ncbi:MAG: hypothetical protein ACRDCE_19430 [Cetobacterium sp.]|uniref:hypothetical protein n=1 Tax=Cetobacterium sp. TaxID=2071632 RepID=UPI003EE7F418
MKINLKKLFIKYLIPAFILEILMLLSYYLKYNEYTKFNYGHVGLYFFFLLGVFVFRALLEYFQNVTGMLMKESWVSRIIFILVALVLFYLYRINGRI